MFRIRAKRFMCLLLSLMLGMGLIVVPDVFVQAATGIDDSAVYIRQTKGSTYCIIASEAMMMRRRAICDNNTNWAKITEASVLPKGNTADGGALNSYIYKDADYGLNMTIGATCLYSMRDNSCKRNSNPQKVISKLKEMLDKHPEGVVVFLYNNYYTGKIKNGVKVIGTKWNHAVLVTSYDAAGNFYCFDPGTGKNKIVNLTSSSLSGSKYANSKSLDDLFSYAVKVWYVASDKNVATYVDKTAPVIDEVKITNVTDKGYTIQCKVVDDTVVDNVKFPTWTTADGQDDIIWNQGSYNSKTRIATYTVKRSAYNNAQGTYQTDIYAYDTSGNYSKLTGYKVDLYDAVPEFKTLSTESVTENDAVLKCTLNGTYDITEWGVWFTGEKGEFTDGNCLKYYEDITASQLQVNLAEKLGAQLFPGTTYKYKWYIVCDDKEYVSDELNFTTPGAEVVSDFPLIDGAVYKLSCMGIYVNEGLNEVVLMSTANTLTAEQAAIIEAKSDMVTKYETFVQNDAQYQRITSYPFARNAEEGFEFMAIRQEDGYSFIAITDNEIYSNKAVDNYYCEVGSGSNVYPVDYSGDASQVFKVVDNGDGRYRIYSAISNAPYIYGFRNVSDVSTVNQDVFLWEFELVQDGNELVNLSDATVNELVEGFVDRMYTVALGREAEEEGLMNWLTALLEGTHDGAKIASEFILGDEFVLKNLNNEQYVDVLYHTFFNREPDAGGKDLWLAVLSSGKPRAYVLSQFVNLPEFTMLCAEYGIERGVMLEDGCAVNPGIPQFVKRLYTTVLGREAENEGLYNNVLALVVKALNAEAVAKNFFTSQEYLMKNKDTVSYVTDLYAVFMGREADEAGLAFWVSCMDEQGMSRDWTLTQFAMSEEFKAIAAGYGIE